jgi:hypothetical protein
VRQVCSHAGGIDDIVEIKLVDEGADFAEQREGLANAAGGSKDDWMQWVVSRVRESLVVVPFFIPAFILRRVY